MNARISAIVLLMAAVLAAPSQVLGQTAPGQADRSRMDQALAELVRRTGATPAATAKITIALEPGATAKIGSLLVVRVTSSVAGQLFVFNQEADGKVYPLFPNELTRNTPRALIKAGETLTIPESREPFQLRITEPEGINRIIAIVVPGGIKLEDLITDKRADRPIPSPGEVFERLAERTLKSRGVAVEPIDRAAGVAEYRIVK